MTDQTSSACQENNFDTLDDDDDDSNSSLVQSGYVQLVATKLEDHAALSQSRRAVYLTSLSCKLVQSGTGRRKEITDPTPEKKKEKKV